MPSDYFKSIFERAKALILKPGETWDAIALEPADTAALYKTWIAPLAAITPIAAFIGASIVGPGFGFRAPIGSGLATAVVSFGLSLASVYVFALIVDRLAPHFGAEQNFGQAFKIAAYFPTAAWLAGVFLMIPALSVLSVVGVYSLYLLFVGLPKLMKAPAEKAGGYTLASIGVALVLYIVVAVVASAFLANTTVRVASDARQSVSSSRADAPANLEEAFGAMLGGAGASGPVVQAEALRALAPGRLAGLRLRSAEVNETAAPFPAAVLVAEYGEVGEESFTLTVTNSTMLPSMMSLLGIAAAGYNREADGEYERVLRDGDDYIVEEWSEASETGRYGRTVAGAFLVEASGRGVSMRDLERAVEAIDARTLERLPLRTQK